MADLRQEAERIIAEIYRLNPCIPVQTLLLPMMVDGMRAALDAAHEEARAYMLDHRRHRKGDEMAAADGIAERIRKLREGLDP